MHYSVGFDAKKKHVSHKMITSLERFHDFVIISHKAFFKQNNLRHRPDILGREEFRDSDNHVNACKEFFTTRLNGKEEI